MFIQLHGELGDTPRTRLQVRKTTERPFRFSLLLPLGRWKSVFSARQHRPVRHETRMLSRDLPRHALPRFSLKLPSVGVLQAVTISHDGKRTFSEDFDPSW